MSGAGRIADRVARILVVLASTWFAFTAVWGMFGIPGGGHIGAGSAGNAMEAEQMLRWHLWYPAGSWYSTSAPSPADYYCHHPFGQYYASAICLWLFGHRDFVVHLPAVLMSAAIPPLLYGIGREAWGRSAGALAACGYVVVPIAVGYSSYHNLETLCIFGALLFYWGHTRHMVTGRTRYMIASLAGCLVAVTGDWVGYLLIAPILGWALLRAFLLPRRTVPEYRFAPYARWWALCVAIAVAALVFVVALFWKADHIQEWFSSAEMRGGGNDAKLADVLKSRASWIEFSFTPVAILVGKIALPVAVLRMIVRRRDEEAYSLALLFGAVVQYVVFRQGADVHIYWPHYFAPYFALALAQLAATVGGVVGWIGRRIRPQGIPATVAWVTLVVGLLPVLAMAPDGVRSLWVWRRTGGRYNDSGALIRSHIDLLTVVRDVVMPMASPGAVLDVSPTTQWGWEHQWAYGGLAVWADSPSASSPGKPPWVARASGLSPGDEQRIARTAHVRIYGDTWVVDQTEPPAPLDAYSMHEHEPNPFQWLFLGGTEPARDLRGPPDPWLTWEWRVHLGQDAVQPQGLGPKTLDEQRIAFNMAMARGDTSAAEHLREQIEAQLDRTVMTHFDPPLTLIGVRVTGGVQPKVESWFVLDGPIQGDDVFNVHSNMEARGAFSTIPPDPVERDMAWPPSLSTKLWRTGWMYKTEVVLNHRIGREKYWAFWTSRDGSPVPRRRDGAPNTALVTLP
jgi:4-amino-4-deoxy-L-arabinose transferase-like glycosyltransferase